MTIIEAINKVDELKPNNYTQTEKIGWLNTLDKLVKRTVLDLYEDADEYAAFTGYSSETDPSTELLVPEPYDEMYIYWLESKIDYSNREYSSFNNSSTRYIDTMREFSNDYNRNHMPKGTTNKYF